MFSGLIHGRQIGSFIPDSLNRNLLRGDCGAFLKQITHRSETVSASSYGPRICNRTGVILLFWGRLDNRVELSARLSVDTRSLTPDLDVVLAGWCRWGTALPDYLMGDFAFAIVDPSRQLIFLARDPLGVKPLFYSFQEGKFVFASSIPLLRETTELKITPDADWMARYVLQLSKSDTQTAYREIKKIPPGHGLVFDTAKAKVGLRRYHHWLDDAPVANGRDQHWLETYRTQLEESIRCRMDGDKRMGTENSGGIDSATITAYLAHFLGEPGDRLFGLSFAVCEQEPSYILETSQARRIVHNYVVTTQNFEGGLDDCISQGLKTLGYPEEHSVGTGHLPFYRLCETLGIHSLFSGFGGDEVVTHPAYYLLRRELLDRGDWRGLWDVIPGNAVTRGLRLAKLCYQDRKNRSGFNQRYLASWNARWPHRFIRDDVIERIGLHELYMEGAKRDAPYRRINDYIINGLISHPYISTRLETCTLMAAAYGVEYRWPLLDVRLIQQYLSTPAIEKVGPQGKDRYLHRRAIEGVVPHRVAWKPSKDMGYSRMLEELNSAALIPLAQRARALEADMEAELRELVDVHRLRQQIKLALDGERKRPFAFSFRRSVAALSWLDAWLKGVGQD